VHGLIKYIWNKRTKEKTKELFKESESGFLERLRVTKMEQKKSIKRKKQKHTKTEKSI